MIAQLRILACLGLLWTGTVMAAPVQHHPRHQPLHPVALPPTAHPALWKVVSGKTTIYLFGTIHALPKGVIWLDGPLANAFDNSDELVTEVILPKPEVMATLMQSTAMLTNGHTLRALLDTKDRQAFEKALKTLGMAPNLLDPFEPWFAADYLETHPLFSNGFALDTGIDAQLNERAVTLKHPHSALETPEYQFGVLNSLPMATQKHFLHEVVLELPTIRKDMAAVIRAWQAGETVKLARLNNPKDDDPVMTELLLTKRNKTWARWIRARLAKSGTVFVAVGAGHLAGKGSVQDQLRALGIRVSRVQ